MAPSISSKRSNLLPTTLYILISISSLYLMRISPATYSIAEFFEAMTTDPAWRFPQNNALVRRTYTGIYPVDWVLVVLTTAFLPGSAKWDQKLWLLHVEFLVAFGALVGVMNVEAARRGNLKKWISYTALWAIPYQTIAGAAIIPIYFICHARATFSPGFWSQQSQKLPISLARTLLPAILLGYGLPTVSLLKPMQDQDSKQWYIAFWQFCPLLINFYWWIFSSNVSNGDAATGGSTPASTTSPREDLPFLRMFYASITALCAAVHFYILYAIFTSSTTTFSDVYIPIWRQTWTPYQSLHFIFQVDFWGIFLAAGIWCLVAVRDLQMVRATEMGVGMAAVGLGVLGVVLGPGAVLSAGWWWREERLARVGVEAKEK